MADDPILTPPATPPQAPPAASLVPTPAATPAGDLLNDPRFAALQRAHVEALSQAEAARLKLQADMEALKGQLTPLQQKLSEHETAAKRAKEAEMSEVERLNAHLKEAQEQARALEAVANAEKEAKLKLEADHARANEAWRNERELMTLLAVKGVTPNAYEMRGLLDDVKVLAYASEEERQGKITGLLDAFVTATRGAQSPAVGQPQANGLPLTAIQPPQGVHTIPVPTPPGGQPQMGTPQLLPDPYSEAQMWELAKSDRALYNRIVEQRAAVRKAKGLSAIQVKYAG